MNISGNVNSSLYPDIDVDIGYIASIKTGVINKSPVLYLRRRRNTDFDRHIGSAWKSESQTIITYLGWTEENFEPVDKGDIYPNHGSKGRIGSIEWTMFRDYKHRRPKWVRSVELVIDGVTNTVIT